MTTFNKVFSAAVLSASLVAGTAGLAQAGTFNTISDIQPSAGRAPSALTAHRVVDTVNTASGMKIIYSSEVLPVDTIGPRDVSEHALSLESYSPAAGSAAPQLSQR
jgi:hypothetical protein